MYTVVAHSAMISYCTSFPVPFCILFYLYRWCPCVLYYYYDPLCLFCLFRFVSCCLPGDFHLCMSFRCYLPVDVAFCMLFRRFLPDDVPFCMSFRRYLPSAGCRPFLYVVPLLAAEWRTYLYVFMVCSLMSLFRLNWILVGLVYICFFNLVSVSSIRLFSRVLCFVSLVVISFF
jgi:hypothetical protein